MNVAAFNETLNDLLINLGKSLLQYVGEAWPWVEEGAEAEHATITALVARQQVYVGALSHILSERGHVIDFGTYPTEYTDLHYVALDYLLSQLVENEAALVDDIRVALERCAGDVQAAALLQEVLRDQQEIAAAVRELARSRADAAAS